MKKKNLVYILIIAMVITTITACSKSSDEQKTKKEVSMEDNYPTKPIKLIVPFSAGGSSDIGARIISKYLEKELGQSIIVENVPGAAGWIGYNKMMQSDPDGYTLSLLTLTYISGYLNPENKKNDNLDSLTPIANNVWDTTAWAVNKNSKFKDLKSLLDYVKEHPGEIKVATSGAYTQHHIALLELEKLGYKMEAVHTGGLADALPMVLGGHIDVASMGAGDIKKQAGEGELLPLAVLDNERSNFIPDVPTFKEASGLDISAYAARGFAGPKSMPKNVIEKLNEAFEKVMKNEEYLKEMDNLGLTVKYMNTQEYSEFLHHVEKEYKEILGW